jgi:hypothetical protein
VVVNGTKGVSVAALLGCRRVGDDFDFGKAAPHGVLADAFGVRRQVNAVAIGEMRVGRGKSCFNDGRAWERSRKSINRDLRGKTSKEAWLNTVARHRVSKTSKVESALAALQLNQRFGDSNRFKTPGVGDDACAARILARTILHLDNKVRVSKNRDIGVVGYDQNLSREFCFQNLGDDEMNYVTVNEFVLRLVNDKPASRGCGGQA